MKIKIYHTTYSRWGGDPDDYEYKLRIDNETAWEEVSQETYDLLYNLVKDPASGLSEYILVRYQEPYTKQQLQSADILKLGQKTLDKWKKDQENEKANKAAKAAKAERLKKKRELKILEDLKKKYNK
jgi:hypothetical protein